MEDGLKIERAMALVQAGYDRPTVAHLMGYPNVQYVHNLVYQNKLREKKRAAQAANPELDRKLVNVERVRKYLEANPNALQKQIMIDLNLAQHTVQRAVRLIGGRFDD